VQPKGEFAAMTVSEWIIQLLKEQLVLQSGTPRTGASPLYRLNVALIEIAITVLLIHDLARLF
jgi:hypothetical protein